MFAKLLVFCAVAALASCLPREYPAGVHPAICPDYPYCDPATLARFTPAGQPIPEWGNAATFYSAPTAPVVAVAPVGDRWPAGVSPAECPNYPYCW